MVIKGKNAHNKGLEIYGDNCITVGNMPCQVAASCFCVFVFSSSPSSPRAPAHMQAQKHALTHAHTHTHIHTHIHTHTHKLRLMQMMGGH